MKKTCYNTIFPFKNFVFYTQLKLQENNIQICIGKKTSRVFKLLQVVVQLSFLFLLAVSSIGFRVEATLVVVFHRSLFSIEFFFQLFS